jgi:transposase-like protein
MTNPTIALVEYLRKMGMDQDKDFLAENYRNGYRERLWRTRVGEIDLRIPKLRVGTYFPGLLEPRRHAEKALLAVLQ